MVDRYPHTGVLSWHGTDRQNTTTGVMIPGTLTTLGIVCRCEPQTSRYIVGTNGDNVAIEYAVYAPLLTDSTSVTVPEGATFAVFSKTFRVAGLHNFQKHTEITVVK